MRPCPGGRPRKREGADRDARKTGSLALPRFEPERPPGSQGVGSTPARTRAASRVTGHSSPSIKAAWRRARSGMASGRRSATILAERGTPDIEPVDATTPPSGVVGSAQFIDHALDTTTQGRIASRRLPQASWIPAVCRAIRAFAPARLRTDTNRCCTRTPASTKASSQPSGWRRQRARHEQRPGQPCAKSRCPARSRDWRPGRGRGGRRGRGFSRKRFRSTHGRSSDAACSEWRVPAPA